jgi:uncharacterized protein YcgI (DUF1989 family)
MLLMKDPSGNRAALPLSKVRIAAASAGSIVVKRGQLLRITALEDGAVASLFGFDEAQQDVHLSVHHTRVFSNSYVLAAGMRLVNNRRRPVMVLGKDSVGQHDLLMPASTTAALSSSAWAASSPSSLTRSTCSCMCNLTRQVPSRLGPTP